ncbi:ataxia telangiectasia mutated family protein [Paragonimus westermani]|uniref:non-specific serine/threonine protein kinase n=1 Tax=Paragonimus westermani TaxID=34504 RepID=A0A5J4NU32_9TREM|nr:ataxia telangiectasia mutated family protein [Paragonimus westermani]
MLALRETTDRVSTVSVPQSLTAFSQQLLLCLVQLAKLLKLATTDVSLPPFSCDVQMLCSLVASDSDLSSVTERLLELAARFAPVRTSSTGNIQGDIFLPRCVRYSCWVAVSSLVTLLLYHPSSPYSQKSCHSGLKNFALWRLVVGHLEILATELSSTYSIVLELLSSLDLLFSSYARTHSGADQDIHMETALHHATVYHLSTIVINLFRPASNGCLLSDDQNVNKEALLAKISTIMDVLLGSKETSVQFQTAICELPNFPTKLAHLPPDACAFFTKYQQSVRKLCTCDRENLLQEMKLCCSSLSSSRILRCPQLARYQCWILDHLNEQMCNWISLNASDSTIDLELDHFQCMTVSSPDELRQACEKICFQLDTNPEDFLASLSSMADMLIELLSPSGVGSFRDKTDYDLLDHPTQKAVFRCLSTVQRLVAHFRPVIYNVLSPTNSAFKEPYSVVSMDSSDSDPSVSWVRKCILGTAHLASLIKSPAAPVACRVLRQLFSNCGPNLDSFISEPDGIASASLLSTLFYPYLQARQLKRRTDAHHSEKLTSLCEQSTSASLSHVLSTCISACLSQPSTSPLVQHLWIDSLLAYHAWEQWRRVQCPRRTQPFNLVPAWLSAAERALDLMRPHGARLFLELAWLADDCPTAWLTCQLRTRRIWLGVCRLFNDLAGLRAAQADFLFPCTSTPSPSLSSNVLESDENSSSPQDLHPMLNETNVVVHEMFGNWDQLLAWHDRSFPTSSTPLTCDMALCLQRMRAHNLLQSLLSSHQPWSIECSDTYNSLSASDTSRNHNSRLNELRAATAWRLGQWDMQYPRRLREPLVPNTAFARTDYGASSGSSFSRYGLEATLFLLTEAAQRHDWVHVARIASWKCTNLMSEVNTLTPITRMSRRSLSNASHQISWFTHISEIANQLAPDELSPNSDTALRVGYLSLLNEAVSFIYLMALPGWSSVDGSASRNTAATLVESLEPFVTGTLRLASSLATQFTTTNLDERLAARSHYLLTQCYLRAASAATDIGQLTVADDWLQNADQCQRVITRFLSGHSGLKPSLYTYQAWQQLGSILSASCLQRLKGEPRLAAGHLQAGLAAVELTFGQLHQDTDPMTRRGLINFYVHSITVLCDWLFELRTKSAADLLTNYLEPAMRLSRDWSVEVGADALASLAQFADAQFVALDSYLSSSEFAARRQLLSDAQHDVACLTDLGEKSRLLRLLQRQSAIEVEELDTLATDADRYLETALDSFAQCLTVSDAHDLKIYRFISLWLSSAAEPSAQSNSDTRKRNINRLMSERVPYIRADKFLPLTPQLAVRLSLNRPGPDQDFQSTLFELVVRIVDGHPHHAAFTLLFLVNAELDNLYDPKTAIAQHPAVLPLRSRQTRLTSSSRKLSSSENSFTDQNQRIQAARRTLTRLMEGRRGPLLRQMQSLAEAYVELANADVDKHRGSTANILLPSGCKLQRFVISTRHRGPPGNRNGELDLVAVPTATPLIDRSGQYPSSGVVFISGFAPTFRLAGGINLPKIITCLGTDGSSFRQIIKGRDDPRQDAVMQQVFSAANCLLARRRYQSMSTSVSVNLSSDTAVRHCSWLNADGGLRMLTYKVIPVAQRSGVIEWCEGTIPLGEWLAADHSGAHQRYRPKDMPPGQAKQRLAAVRDRPPERRCAVFEEICEKLSPVLAYFYLEHFPEPHSWCRARSSYTRSLAVSSLIGYLVGLGDRHPHNLLLHRASGELVHIDLGVAFDQGRLLPTPEMVPFRLTRDLVHALGPLGLEAGFKPAAETVLSELRNGGDVICTLLQVLLYDPLYSWSLTPAQLCALEARRAECSFGLMRSKPSASVLADQTNLPVERDFNADPSGTVPIDQRSVLDVAVPRSKLSNTTVRDPVNQLAERVLLNVRSKLAGRVTGTLAAASSEQRKCGGLDQLDVAGHVGLLVHAATNRSNLARMYFGWQAYL